MGDCLNDTMRITGLDGVSAATVPASLCGDLTGHESKDIFPIIISFYLCHFKVYLTVKSQTGPTQIEFDIGYNQSSVSRFRIQVTQLSCEDTELLAPPGCLTYNTETFGAITSFNFANGTGEMINNQKFSHCIKPQEGFCDVMLIFIDLDLGAPDWLGLASASEYGYGDSLTFGSKIVTGARDLQVDASLENAQIICKFLF